MAVQSRVVLEPSAQAIVDATSQPPFLYELEPAAARKVLDDLQAAPIDNMHGGGWILGNAATHDRLVPFAKARRRDSTPGAWPSPASRWAATWPQR
jgi:hypothetical protein